MRFHSDTKPVSARLPAVLRDPQPLSNYGVFALHSAQMAMFTVLPLLFSQVGRLDLQDHWQVYLPVCLAVSC